MENLIHILFAVLYVVSCCFFFWITLLLVLPKKKFDEDNKKTNPEDVFFYLLIPCLNEEKVIRSTIINLLSLNIPNTTVIAIDDGSTDDTSDVLLGIDDPNFKIVSRVLPDARKGKGMALNAGYEAVKKEVDKLDIDHSKVIIGVFDADTSVEPGLFSRVINIMTKEPKAGLVQSRIRVKHLAGNYFMRLQDIEFFMILNCMQNLRDYTGTVSASGNGQFSRLSAMETLGKNPWTQCLLEDINFSTRLLLNGWKTRLIQDAYTWQQGVSSYSKFVKQRSRWAQGNVQCFSYLRDIINTRHLSIMGKAELFSFLLMPWLVAVLFISTCLSLLLAFYLGVLPRMLSQYSTSNIIVNSGFLIFLIILSLMSFARSYRKEQNCSLFQGILMGLLTPIFFLIQIPSVFIAFWRQFSGKHSWVKTTHESN